MVFDSSAKYQGVSLNDVLLTGPNLNNGLVGVLIRFREELVAVTADIQQMFHSFLVREDHSNFLRFLWFRDDSEKDIIEYRMTVHVFGNSPSPAVAIIGLRKAAQVKHFIETHFYVDDGLRSVPTEMEAISLLKDAQELLAASNLWLHKIASNSSAVMTAFPREDLVSGLKDLDLSTEFPPMQRSLGISWDIPQDTFTFHVPAAEKPFTRRGVLSTINTLFDPLGFAIPVSIKGRALLRKLTGEIGEWDEPLPEIHLKGWQEWRDSLKLLKQIQIPRPYTSFSPADAKQNEICIFCDASTQAIAAVAYLKATSLDGKVEVAFVFGRAKLAPRPELTIPRLELCAAVLAVEIADMIKEELDIQYKTVRFFSDSRVVLGYIYNKSRGFHVYVSNRVQRIRQASQPEQWSFVPSEQNPADHGSRSLPAAKLSSSSWLKGPAFLLESSKSTPQESVTFDLVDPEADEEIHALLTSTSQAQHPHMNTGNFQRFSSWRRLIRAIARLVHMVQAFKARGSNMSCKGWHMCSKVSPSDFDQAKEAVVRSVQHEAFCKELELLKEGKELFRASLLIKLSPYVDANGLLRVGGRLSHSDLQSEAKNPLIMPRQHHITDLLIRHHHERLCYQGRHFTEGALRSAGLWIFGRKRRVSSLIYLCVTCRKLRRQTETQKMSDLPMERLSTEPPFTYVGMDVFVTD